MKKLFALAIVCALVLAMPALAGDEKKMEKGEWAKGTITAWDDATKTMKVKDDSGKEWSFAWNDKTMVHGKAAVGEMVKLEFTKDKDGKPWATHVYVGKEEISKFESKKEPAKAGTHN